MGATATLAEFVRGAGELEIPDHLQSATELLILDSLGCALGGHSLEGGRVSVAYAERQPGSCTVIGGSKRVSPEAAVFANSQLINMLDFDEVLLNWGHVMPFVLPVAMAVAEQEGATGADVLRAVLVGYEVGARVSAALTGPIRAVGIPPILAIEGVPLFGYSSNIFGSVAAAAVLRKNSHEQIVNAFGIASFVAPVQGTTGFAAGSTIPMSKYGVMGAIAQSGYAAATLASMGFTSRNDTLDRADGFAKLVGSIRFDPSELTKDLGTAWWLPQTSYKLYPSCRFVHVAIDNVVFLARQHAIQPDEVTGVKVRLWPQVAASPLFRIPQPNDPLDAQFNIPYSIAAALCGRSGFPDFIDPATMADPLIKALALRVEVLPEPRLTTARYEQHGRDSAGPMKSIPCEVTITTGRGEFTKFADTAVGDQFDPARAISSEQLRRKFRSCAASRVSEDAARQIEETVLGLRGQGSLDKLAAALMPEA